MSSQKQITANRQNAQNSTGPKTEEGKAAVSQNAIKHGLTARQDVIATESQELYDLHRHKMLIDLNPIGATEFMLAERIVSLSWRLDRAVTIQTQVTDALLEDFERVHKNTLKDHDPYYPSRKNPDLKLGSAVRNDIRENIILDRLLMYERRIERSLYKTMAELRDIQKSRKQSQSRTNQAEPSNIYLPAQSAQNKAKSTGPENDTTSRFTIDYAQEPTKNISEDTPNQTLTEAFNLGNIPNIDKKADSPATNNVHAATAF